MNLLFKVAIATLPFLSFYSFANQSNTEAYVCHNCSFSDAKNVAETKYDLPDCEFTDLNGGPATIDSPMFCNSTNRTIAILNPQDRTVWKFNVHAHFPNQYFLEVTATSRTLSSDEFDAADIFFDFYDDVMEVTTGGFLAINPTAFENSQISNESESKVEFGLKVNTDSANTSACTVAREYFGSQTRQDNVEAFLERDLAQRLDSKNPYDLNEDTDFTGAGFQVAKGSVGFNLSWDSEEHPVVMTIGDTTTRLVFALEFKGNLTRGSGNYEINMYLDRNASRIDNRRVDNAFPNGTVNDVNDTTSNDHPCLREIAKDTADNAPWGAHEGGGQPSVINPIGSGEFPSFCVRTVRVRTCSTDKHGQTCTNSEYSFPESCP